MLNEPYQRSENLSLHLTYIHKEQETVALNEIQRKQSRSWQIYNCVTIIILFTISTVYFCTK